MTIRKLHRYLALFAAAFWLIQISTGLAIVFSPELDNATLRGESVPADAAALGARIHTIEQAGGHVSSLWVASRAADRFDVFYHDQSGVDRLMRVDGAGRVLRDGSGDALFTNGGFFRTLTSIHTSLLAGDVGEWIVAVSGVLLFSSLALGLKLAWPRAGMWRRSLFLQPARNAAARFYGIHRTIGLWVATPTLLIIAAGLALVFADTLEGSLNVAHEPPVAAPRGSSTTPAEAIAIALTRFPGSTLTLLAMPADGEQWFRIRVHAAGEVPRLYGSTTLYVSTADGSVLREYPAAAASARRTFYDLIYPFHTGQLGALPGRIVLLSIGVLLITLGVFGIRLWLTRRKPQRSGA